MTDIAPQEENQGVVEKFPPWTQELVRERVIDAMLTAANEQPGGYRGLADAVSFSAVSGGLNGIPGAIKLNTSRRQHDHQ